MRCVIFDLDGTLTQSHEGILNSIAHAAETMGFALPPEAERMKFVGPPLDYSFRNYLGMTPEESMRAVALYRERYWSVGMFENRVYPGIRNLLRMLKRRGDWVAVATGKPTEPSRKILEHFGLLRYFDRVVGPDENDHRAEKETLIRRALPETWEEAVMVGDRCFDIEGGRKVGIRTVGVCYGYGTEAELREADCDETAATVDTLINLLCPGEARPAGAFLSVEGLDGSGKSTQIGLLADALDRWGFEVVHSREPGGSPVGEKIRDILLDPQNRGMEPLTEALLFAASRAQHVREVIRPAVAAGKTLLCDRFVDSSVAYQGGGRGLGVQRVLEINREAVDGTWPLVTLYLDIPHREALKRRMAASDPDRMEAEPEDFHRRVEEAYRAMIAAHPERFAVVDATRSAEEVGKQAAEQVLSRLMAAEEA